MNKVCDNAQSCIKMSSKKCSKTFDNFKFGISCCFSKNLNLGSFITLVTGRLGAKAFVSKNSTSVFFQIRTIKTLSFRRIQCDQIGLLWESLGDIFSYKINFLCYFKNLSLCVKTSSAPIWATLVKIGLLFILESGHTGWESLHYDAEDRRRHSAI